MRQTAQYHTKNGTVIKCILCMSTDRSKPGKTKTGVCHGEWHKVNKFQWTVEDPAGTVLGATEPEVRKILIEALEFALHHSDGALYTPPPPAWDRLYPKGYEVNPFRIAW